MTTPMEKKKYVIQDMPEMTVGNFLLNKNTQESYFSKIKKEGNNTEALEESKPNTTTTLSNNIVLQTKSAPAQLNTTATKKETLTSTSGNISTVTKTVSYTTQGNVISFNKSSSHLNTSTLTSTSPSSNILKNTPINSSTVGVKSSPSLITPQVSPGNLNILNKPVNNPLNKNLTTLPNKTSTAPSTSKSEFSESLQKFISRAYEKCKTDLDRNKCQKALMKIMSAALKKGDLNTRDWNLHPLPIFPSEMGQSTAVNKTSILTEQEVKNRDKRKSRFDSDFENFSKEIKNPNINISNISTPSQTLEELTKNVTIIGTCQSLEKQYLRLTTIPDPSQVRPENILQKSLKLLKDKWKNKHADYNYISEQFRSIRQDMTIQHIQNDFTVKVYETHARIALENLDLDQFNQCQTALIALYNNGLNGHNIEFLAYRIIYTILQGIKYDMENLLIDVHKMEKKSKIISKNLEISHALKVMKAINANNYFEFFNLYKIAPNMGSYLIEPFLPRLRIKALLVCATGYFTEANVGFLWDKLAFEKEECFIKFLEENNVVLSGDRKRILFKESLSILNNSKLLASIQFKISNIY
jgi:SAC3 family protein LENG8/THP3